MTQSTKVRPFLPVLSVAAALAAGAVQAQDADDLRRVPLCTLPYEMPLPASVLDRIRGREDFEDLLRYSSENCPETALILTDGATASTGGTGGGAAAGAGGGDRSLPVCRLEEAWPLSQRALNRIRSGGEFEDLLRYTSENCPEVALLLADTATATVPGGGDEGETGGGREGPNPGSFPTPDPAPSPDPAPTPDPAPEPETPPSPAPEPEPQPNPTPEPEDEVGPGAPPGFSF